MKWFKEQTSERTLFKTELESTLNRLLVDAYTYDGVDEVTKEDKERAYGIRLAVSYIARLHELKVRDWRK